MSVLVRVLSVCALVACDGQALDHSSEPEQSAGGEGGSTDDGLVSISFALEEGTTDAGLKVKLQAVRASGGVPIVFDRGLGGIRAVMEVHLPADVWDLTVEVSEAGDPTPSWTGSATGVTVVAGKITAIAMPLSASGGVQIVASFSTLGRNWTCNSTNALPGVIANKLLAAQRLEPVDGGGTGLAMTYYLWKWDYCGAVSGFNCETVGYVYRTQVGSETSGPELFGPNGFGGQMSLPSMADFVTVLGDRFVAGRYHYEPSVRADPPLSLWESTDGVSWTSAAVEDAHVNVTPGAFYKGFGLYELLLLQDVSGPCAALSDNGLTLFCGFNDPTQTVDPPQAGKLLANFQSVVRMTSDDGVRFPELPPVTESSALRNQPSIRPWWQPAAFWQPVLTPGNVLSAPNVLASIEVDGVQKLWVTLGRFSLELGHASYDDRRAFAVLEMVDSETEPLAFITPMADMNECIRDGVLDPYGHAQRWGVLKVGNSLHAYSPRGAGVGPVHWMVSVD